MSEKATRVQAAMKALPDDVRSWLGQKEMEKIAALCEDVRESPALIAHEVARDAALRVVRNELRRRGCFDAGARDAACKMIFDGVDPIAAATAVLATQSENLPQAAAPSAAPGSGPKPIF